MALEERRMFGRRTYFKPAAIVLGQSRTPATVYDMSESGLRLRSEFNAHIKQEFTLEIPEVDFVVCCRVAWIDGRLIGAEFCKSPQRMSWQSVRRQDTHDTARSLIQLYGNQ